MNFNFDTGAIDTIQTLDCSTTPPVGGVAGVLEIIGSGALILNQGTTAERPSGVGGMFRWNDETTLLEYYNGTSWETLSTSSGSVTSVAATSSSTALSITGSPITSTGTFDFTLSASLEAIDLVGSTGGSGIIVKTATDVFTPRSIAGTASNISVTNGDGVAGNPTIDLVNAGTPITNSFVKITTDAKGRVTASSAVVAGDITPLVDSSYVNVGGDSMSGDLIFTGGATVTGLPDPVADGDAVPKSYVDAVATGLSWKQTVIVATTADIDLTTGGLLAIDGVTVADGDRVLVKDQAAPEENGIYLAAAGAWVRAIDMDATTPINEINGAATFVQQGTTQADTAWVQYLNVTDLDTDPVDFTQFGGMSDYTAGTGLTLIGNEFSLTSPVAISLGGTGLATTPSNGQLLIGNGTGYTLAAVTAGAAISVTNGAGSITIANTGVTSAIAGTGISVDAATGAVTITNDGVLSIAGTANQIAASAATGAVTLSLPSAVIAPGSVEVTTTLAVASNTANTFAYSNASKQLVSTAAPTNGQLLIGSTGAAPVVAALTAGTGISVTNGAGSITIANTGVTSVALSDASATPIYTVSGSPVTTTGTLTVTLAAQTANTVFAGPTTGGSDEPTFRALVAADLPPNAGLELYAENAVTPDVPTASGTNAQAFGEGASASVFGSKAFANGSFAADGDAQAGIYVLRGVTNNATPAALFLDGAAATQRLVFANNSVVTFDILVASRRTDATGGGSGYRFVGVIRKDGTSASNTIVGTVSKTVIGETNVAWDVNVTANTTNGDLRVTVTGEAAKTIRWVATVRTTEVTN